MTQTTKFHVMDIYFHDISVFVNGKEYNPSNVVIPSNSVVIVSGMLRCDVPIKDTSKLIKVTMWNGKTFYIRAIKVGRNEYEFSFKFRAPNWSSLGLCGKRITVAKVRLNVKGYEWIRFEIKALCKCNEKIVKKSVKIDISVEGYY